MDTAPLRVLVTAPEYDWLQQLEQLLVATTYHVLTTDSCDDAYAIYTRQAVDAVIALVSPEALDFFQRLRQEQTNSLLILVLPHQQSTYSDLAKQIADIVIPPPPEQLDLILMLQLENRKLQDDNQHLRQTLRESEEARNETELLKNAIVRNVSHELRTPLLQVKSAVAMMNDADDLSKLIYYAESAVAKLESSVKNITLLGTSLDIKPNPIILRDSIASAQRELRRIWTHRNDVERIHLHIDDQLPPVLADKQGLNTVMQLLIDNALKFSQEQNTPVEVIGRLEGDDIYIAVRDYGIGIKPDKLQKIFDTFYQIDSSSTRPYGGTGVGLAIVKLILKRHHAAIQVESQHKKGSTFWFRLPAVDITKL
jgi:signal transduction histidine kinase